MSASTARDNVGVVDLKRRAVHIGAGVGPGVTVQINRSVDTAGIEGRAGRIITKQNNRFAAGSLRLERLVHRVVGVFADLGEVCLRYAVSAVAVLRNCRVLDHILGRVIAECATGDLDGRLILAGSGFLTIAFCTERTVDRAAGDRDLRQLAFCAVKADGFNVAVDRAAADRERGV